MDIDHMAATPGEQQEKVNVSWRGHCALNYDTHTSPHRVETSRSLPRTLQDE